MPRVLPVAALLAALVLVASLLAIQLHSIMSRTLSVSGSATQRKEANNGTGIQATGSKMIIMVHSGAALKEQRDLQRKFCFPLYQDIPHYFVVGMPSFDDRRVDGHDQGQLATQKEIDVAQMLLEEQRLYGDILVTPHRDYYRDLTEKLMGVLRFGVERNAEYIIKADDDYCVDLTVTKHMLEKHELEYPATELYGGIYYFAGTEYQIMKGPRNETAPFMSGHIIIVSRVLAQTIVGPDDWTQNILKAAYGTSSDDANLGKMIVRASEAHNISVDTSVDKNIELCELHKSKNTTQLLQECSHKVVSP